MTDLQQVIIDFENRLVTPIHIDTGCIGSTEYRNVLLDTTKDKKWISYITQTRNRSTYLKTYLTVCNLTKSHHSFETTTLLSIDITDLYDQFNYLKFLSISPNGKTIALSFYTPEDNIQQAMDYNCFIFELTNNRILLRRPPIRHQGRAVFTDNNLAIMTDTCVHILDKEYKDLYSLQFPKHLVYDDVFSANQFLVSWIDISDPSYNTFEQPEFAHKTLFLQQKYVILFNVNNYCLWSIEDKCNKLTISDGENFVTMMNDEDWCITYNEDSHNFKLIDIASGAIISMFKSRIKHDKPDVDSYIMYGISYGESSSNTSLGVQNFISDARIINSGSHLVMSGISKDLQDRLHIWSELWNIESGLSVDWIYKPHKNDALYDPLTCHHTVWPFILDYFMNEEADSSISKDNESSYQSSRSIKSSLRSLGSSSTPEKGGREHIRDKSLRKQTRKLQEVKRLKGNLTFIYSDYQEIVSEEWEAFGDTSTHSYSILGSKDISVNSRWKKYPGWEDDDRNTSICKKKSRYYWARWNTETLRLWSFDHLSTVALHIGPDYTYYHYDDTPFEETLSESGHLLCSFSFKCRMDAHSSFFIEKDGQYGRLLVETPSESDKRSFFEEFILPLDVNDDGASNYYGYNLKNACKTVSSNPQKTQVTKPLLFDMLTKLKSHPSSFFTTTVGCHTLDLLVSSEELHDVLYHLLKNDQLPIIVHPFEEESTHQHEDINNVLIDLIHQKKNDLFNLMLNRLLLSRSEGANCFSVLTETLIYLQNQGQRELLLETCKKLSFLDIDQAVLPTALDFCYESPSANISANIQSLDTFSTLEQLQSHAASSKKSTVFIRFVNDCYLSYFNTFRRSTFIDNLSDMCIIRILQKLVAYLKDDYQKYKRPIQAKYLKICIVPLIHFNSYYVHPIDKQLTKESIKTGKPFNESLFLQTATKIDDNNIFNEGDLVFEIMLEHKWKHFAQWRFFVVCLIHIMFYVSYTVGISFATKVFDYAPGSQITHGGQIICLCLMFTAELILLIQELRQALKAYSKIYYLRSPYNWIDWVSLILPIIMLRFLRQNNSAFNELNSFTALILWLHGIIRVRVFRTIGVTLETVIQLVFEVKGILLVFFLIVCAFTNSFIVLLMDKEDEYFQEQFSGNMIPFEASNDSIYDTTFRDISASNPFKDVFKSFSTLWFFIFGVWDPITDGDAGDNRVIIVLGILFSLLTILIFFNLVIVYMSGKIEEIRKKGKKAWTRHYASVVAEIEQLWCHPKEKIDRNMHPSYIYYYAHVNDVDRQARAIEDDTEEIVKRLDKVYGADIPRKHNEKDRPLLKEDVIEILRGFFDKNNDRFTPNKKRLRSRKRPKKQKVYGRQ